MQIAFEIVSLNFDLDEPEWMRVRIDYVMLNAGFAGTRSANSKLRSPLLSRSNSLPAVSGTTT
jgi:hypothetical protein